jgi:hypothetical protein
MQKESVELRRHPETSSDRISLVCGLREMAMTRGRSTTRHICALAVAMCLALVSCRHSGESAASTSSGSFRVEIFEVRIGETTEKVNGASVPSAFFRQANAVPLVGRLFLDEEYQRAEARVVVIADSLWRRRFGGDPAVIGRTLSVNQQQRTVVGILPKTFRLPTGVELWIPQTR